MGRLGWLVAVAGLAVCGSSTQGGADLAPGDLGPGVLSPKVVATPEVPGLASQLDASGSTDSLGRTITFAWTVVAAPSGSTVKDASLSSASGAKISFEADLGGDYQVKLTVSTPDGATASVTTTVTVPTLALFYQQGTFTTGGSSVALGMVRSDGSGAHLVSCPIASDAGADSINGFAFASFYAVSAFDAAAGSGQRSRFAFPEAAGNQQRLLIADEQSDCATHAPVRVDQSSDMFYSTKVHFWPRFSPDGSRVVYVDNPRSPPASRLVSVAVDGSALRVIRTGTGADLSAAPPVWVDATHVAWVENLGTAMAPKHVIYQSSDASFAGDSTSAPGDRTTLADCTNVLAVLNQFAVTPAGVIVAGGTQPKAKGGALNLYRMTNGQCTTSNVLVEEPANGDAGDFAVSPDGKLLAISSTHGQSIPDGGATPQHDIFVLPTGGASPPTKLAGDPLTDDLGPRWVAGGRQLVWTQGSLLADGGLRGGGLMIANADGTHVRSLVAEGDAQGEKTVIIGGTNSGVSCSWVGATGGGMGASALVALGLLLLFLRRRST